MNAWNFSQALSEIADSKSSKYQPLWVKDIVKRGRFDVCMYDTANIDSQRNPTVYTGKICKDWSIFLSKNFNHKIYQSYSSVSFSSCQRNLIKNISDWSHYCTDHNNGNDFFMSLVKWPKIAVKKDNFLRNFRNKSCSILMLHKVDKNKKVAPKSIFFNKNVF